MEPVIILVGCLSDFEQSVSVLNTSADDHFCELPSDIGHCFVPFLLNKQLVGMGILLQLSLLQHHDSICVNDRGESMSHDEHSTVVESLTNGSLDEVIGLKINICSGFVEDQDSRLLDDGSG